MAFKNVTVDNKDIVLCAEILTRYRDNVLIKHIFPKEYKICHEMITILLKDYNNRLLNSK